MKCFYPLLLGLVSWVCLPFSIQAQSTNPISTVKFGKGLSIMAPDSSLYLKASFRFQTLFVTAGDIQSHSPWQSSATVRRARLKFDGWAVSPKLVYKVELALSNQDLKSSSDYTQAGGAPKIILDAVVKWRLHKNFELWAGQTKLPGNRERVVSSQKLQFVDRSMVNSIFNIDRDMGLHLRGKFHSGKALIRPIFAVAMGEGRNMTVNNIGGLNYTGRLEYLPLGEFTGKGDYFDADLKREPTPKLMLGVSYNINKGASRQKQSGIFLMDAEGNYLDNDLQTVFVDGVFKYQGFSLSAEYADKKCVLPDGMGQEEAKDKMIDANGKSYHTGKGFNIQAGYLFKKNWEVAARYTTVSPDWEMSFTGTEEYSLGLSKYIVGHNLKVQSDVSLIDKENKDINGLRYRLQFEVAF
ncbi:MAG: hypothetical protein H6560_20125 [Lewinellaceae bacterium]|nr:hypothetical protein [Lewinellaceae bacterium]